jgi:hypothetical protein
MKQSRPVSWYYSSNGLEGRKKAAENINQDNYVTFIFEEGFEAL